MPRRSFKRARKAGGNFTKKRRTAYKTRLRRTRAARATQFRAAFRRRGAGRIRTKRRFGVRSMKPESGIYKKSTVIKGSIKLQKQAAVYTSAFKHILCHGNIVNTDSKFNINNIGDNNQAQCRWYADPSGWSPAGLDGALTWATGLAANANPATMEVFLESSRTKYTLRNNAVHSNQLDIYLLWPRKDILASQGVVTGSDPALFTQGYSDVLQTPGTVSIPGANYVSSSIYMSTTFTSMFKITKVASVRLHPGQEFQYSVYRKKPVLFKKTKLGIPTTTAISAIYNLVKAGGPMVMFRVAGSVVHDGSLEAYPMNNTNLNPTFGTFNMDAVVQRHFVMRSVFVTPCLSHGQITTLPSTILKANEYDHELAQEEKAMEA